mmetsp:Transcript_49954/g.89697  ORF Transcript_49954/g.89697 Transcript_49954/m.89697 type:complete len:209 (+) Transcript_49954:56-682(+)|eukprot:CAMPEP_0197638138 /NCGR_PEP_ID=MMETSP1338-20131121/13145_1 /TAXON_ID=43686 ORGANISM="Pelagodinium beii, Strain RCC1491" /NCGR_SAMPLE_ID=MMETSP1338 /ASSEMBLY_ACC=CAM_ASM_000754 /LENGTH=208 /DNA_ID=CAMNT_0043210659 /DNA_START=40 /DNA_END=666 /DNA_ORIENTATION=+
MTYMEMLSSMASISKRFDVEISALSLHGHNGQWRLYGNIEDTLREKIEDSKLFKVLIDRAMPTVILDTQLSSLTKNDPLVAAADGSRQIRFYMEVPLLDSDETVIGALILADGKPRLEEVPVSEIFELTAIARKLEVSLAPEAFLPSQSSRQYSDPGAAELEDAPPNQPRSFTTSTATTGSHGYSTVSRGSSHDPLLGRSQNTEHFKG